ncbi:MAG: hypothetical protein DME22_24540 [Verrucomicrobia bacterium]|nr:MAG: hypothetical protein DME22_24540 [Verrucomicrobiota bacterium]PYJ96412.1 MAG: hypothetical protein DME23_20835 [Verrucomicrobiota bacterium]
MWIDAPPGGQIDDNSEFDRLAEVRAILTDDYPHAKRAIYTLEVFSRKRSRRAVYELRDTLDHLSIALNANTSPAEARRHMHECKTHLRRAAVEPFEWLAERKTLQIEKMAVRGRWLYALLCLQKPDLKPEGTDLIIELKAIAQKIVEGRITKATAASVKHMEDALRMADALMEKLKPKQFYDRLYSLLLFLAGTIFALLLRLVF